VYRDGSRALRKPLPTREQSERGRKGVSGSLRSITIKVREQDSKKVESCSRVKGVYKLPHRKGEGPLDESFRPFMQFVLSEKKLE